MKYNYEYNVNYQEVDGAKKIRLFNLENYILEVTWQPPPWPSA